MGSVILSGLFLAAFSLRWTAWQPVRAAAAAQVLYVDHEGMCNSQMPCLTHPQQAVDAASPGDVIKMQADTFTATSLNGGTTQLLYLDKNLTLIGGYDETYQEPPQDSSFTTFSPEPANRIIYVAPNISVTLSNLLLTGGDYNVNPGTAMHIENAMVTLRSSTIISNTGNACPGVYAWSSLVKLEQNEFSGNVSNGPGGAICLDYADNDSRVALNRIYRNSANEATAMRLDNSNLQIEANKIYDNYAVSGSTAGIWMHGGSYFLANNYLGDNRSVTAPSALHLTSAGSAFMLHNTFKDNQADDLSHVIQIDASGNATMYNNILVSGETLGVYVGDAGFLTADTNLFYGVTPVGSATGGIVVLSNTIEADPLLDTIVSYAISPDSPAEGRALQMIGIDIDGRLRPVGSGPDLGAMEALASHAVTTTQDALVDFADPSGLTTTVFIPANTFTGCLNLLYSALQAPGYSFSDTLKFAGRAFDIETGCIYQAQVAVYLPLLARSSGTLHFGEPLPVAQPPDPLATAQQLTNPVTITLGYAHGDVVNIDENFLRLYFWNGQDWVDAATTCTPASLYRRNPLTNQIEVAICHLSRFGLGGH